MQGMFIDGMINMAISNDATEAILVLNNLLEPDFLAYARKRGWEYLPMPSINKIYTGYKVIGEKAVKELAERAVLNPWFAFNDADKYYAN